MDNKHQPGNFYQPINANEGVSLPADKELERMAVQRAEQEEEPRMPETPEEMIAATLEPATGSVDRLLTILSRSTRSNLSSFQDILIQIQERLHRYLHDVKDKKGKTETSPSAYAQKIFHAGADRSADLLIDDLSRFTGTMIAELNPLFHKAWKEYQKLTKSIQSEKKLSLHLPATMEEFFASFEKGDLQNQKVYSFFGIVEKISEANPSFPQLDLTRPYVPKELIVLDPFGSNQFSYWNDAQRLHKSIYEQDISLSDNVRTRTERALDELGKLLQDSGDADLNEAVELIGFWLNGELSQIEGMNDDELKKYSAGVHFAYGEPNEIMGFLNFLEILKQKEPVVYARILGRSAQAGSPEATRSDLFGNMLHVALYNSLHLYTGRGMSEYQDFNSFVTGLTKIDARQDELGLISDEDMARFEQEFLRHAEAEMENPFLGVAALRFGEFSRAYRLRKMLEKVSAENRERLLVELRNATPKEFIHLLNDRRIFPQPIESYAPDWMDGSGITVHAYKNNIPVAEYAPKLPTDIEAVFVERGLGEILADRKRRVEFLRMPSKFRPPLQRPFGVLIDVVDRIYGPDMTGPIKKEWEEEISGIVWRTTPSEKLLAGDEFYKYIQGIADKISKRGGGGFDVSSQNQEDIAPFLDIINVHSDVDKVDWFKWFALRAGKFTGEGLKKSEAAHILRIVFREMPEYFLLGSSSFLRLYQFIFGYSDKFIAIAQAEHSSLEEVFEKYVGVEDTTILFYLLTHIDTQAQSPQAKERSLENFDSVNPNSSLTPDEYEVMENLKRFTQLIEPFMLADYVTLFFVHHPGAFELFCTLLTGADRDAFLVGVCDNAPGSLHTEWSEKEAPLRVISAAQYLADGNIPRSAKQVTLLYAILKESSRDIPDSQDYLDLKKLVAQHGYQSNQESGGNRRIRYEEGAGWILEEGRLITMGEGENSWQGIWNNALQVMKNELEWKEI
ncbi:MAG: hypothetical protein Q8P56_06835, partial [Candidatus Uhrbacteria bacterium]|nr:hypothetical protein [Candidatus Uhrbacteria bacterium]